MAILETNDPLLKYLRGKLGKQLVFKQYGDVTVVTNYPHMRMVKRSDRQKQNTNRFKEAVAYAKSILQNLEAYATFAKKVKRKTSVYYGKTVYHAAMTKFFKNSGLSDK